jgi:phenylacetate-CoA ligase
MSDTIYFALQRLREGVSPQQIGRARRLLDSTPDVIDQHVRNRLAVLHGASAGEAGWLDQQPLMLRSTLVERHRALIGQRPPHAEVRRTSGSTGTPFSFVKDKEMAAWMDAAMWAVYAWHGVSPGDRRLRFWGMPLRGRARWKRRLADILTGQIRLSAFRVAPEDCREFFLRARRFRPAYAYGYPALMSLWASECTALGLDGRELGVRVVIGTGELLPPETRKRLRRFFGCPVVNEYGCSESGILAFECEAAVPHTVPVAAMPQVVRPDGSPTSAGEIGEVVVSDLYGRYLPMLRYRLHDVAAVGEDETCACGRHLRHLQVSVGRQDSFIQLPGGGRIYDAILAYSVPPGVASFRVFQRSRVSLEAQITLVPGAAAEPTVKALQAAWTGAIGHDVQLAVEVVESLPFEHSGKLRYFVPLSP